MNQQTAPALTLFDLVARRWQAPAPATAACFGPDGIAAFALADGTLLLADTPDPEPPARRIRVTGDLGQLTIRPREADPPALTPVSGLADGAVPLAADRHGLLAGAADGRVLRLLPGGAAETVLAIDGAVTALAASGDLVAAADALGLATPAWRLSLPGVTTLAATEGRIAAATASGLYLVDTEAKQAARDLPGAVALAWQPGGRWLGAGLGGGGAAVLGEGEDAILRLPDFPAEVRAVGWSARGEAFLAAGAFRIAAWDAGALPAAAPLATGRPGLVAVTALAAHPARPLVAAGFANGQVAIARPGHRDELLLRHAGGEVRCLAFSPDGAHLALGDADGSVAIATFPPQMFK